MNQPLLQYHIEIRTLANEDGFPVVVTTQYYKGNGCYTFQRCKRFVATKYDAIKIIADSISYSFPPEEYIVTIESDHFTPIERKLP